MIIGEVWEQKNTRLDFPWGLPKITCSEMIVNKQNKKLKGKGKY